jgi:ketosteroid isomerase-like protein
MERQVVDQFEFRREEFGAVGTKQEASLTQSRHTSRLKQAAGCCFAISVLVQCACNRQPEGKMETSNSPLAAETNALRKAYAAFNRNDIAATVEALDPQIEWTEPAEFPGGGTYHGHEGVKVYLSQLRAAWAEVRSEPERFIVVGDKIIVFVHVRAKPQDSTEWHERRLADVFTFHKGKAIQMRTFADRRQALEWVGVKDSDAN